LPFNRHILVGFSAIYIECVV